MELILPIGALARLERRGFGVREGKGVFENLAGGIGWFAQAF